MLLVTVFITAAREQTRAKSRVTNTGLPGVRMGWPDPSGIVSCVWTPPEWSLLESKVHWVLAAAPAEDPSYSQRPSRTIAGLTTGTRD